MSSKINVTVALKLLELCAVYGVPAIQTILKNWAKEEITVDDVKNIGTLVRKPEHYFR